VSCPPNRPSQFCIVGATSGTGLLIANQLLHSGKTVSVIARDPVKAEETFRGRVCVNRADVRDPLSIRKAVGEKYQAIFFTVAARGGLDGRGLFGTRTAIRDVTYLGLANVVDAARSNGFKGRLVVASLLGVDQRSLMISLLDVMKPGLKRNLIEREIYLQRSGLDYTIVRAPILTDGKSARADIRLTGAGYKLKAGSTISRGDLARVMILAANHSSASRKTFGLISFRGEVPSDEHLLRQLESI
jgi:uncharacterized protein YbjT (DUF2867 family)